MAEQAFDIVEKLSEELGEKESRIMELEKQLETLKEKHKDAADIIYLYVIRNAVYEWCDNDDDYYEKGQSATVWSNCFDSDSPMEKDVASEENLEAIKYEVKHLKGFWEFYWNKNYDLMARKLYESEHY